MYIYCMWETCSILLIQLSWLKFPCCSYNMWLINCHRALLCSVHIYTVDSNKPNTPNPLLHLSHRVFVLIALISERRLKEYLRRSRCFSFPWRSHTTLQKMACGGWTWEGKGWEKERERGSMTDLKLKWMWWKRT